LMIGTPVAGWGLLTTPGVTSSASLGRMASHRQASSTREMVRASFRVNDHGEVHWQLVHVQLSSLATGSFAMGGQTHPCTH